MTVVVRRRRYARRCAAWPISHRLAELAELCELGKSTASHTSGSSMATARQKNKMLHETAWPPWANMPARRSPAPSWSDVHDWSAKLVYLCLLLARPRIRVTGQARAARVRKIAGFAFPDTSLASQRSCLAKSSSATGAFGAFVANFVARRLAAFWQTSRTRSLAIF